MLKSGILTASILTITACATQDVPAPTHEVMSSVARVEIEQGERTLVIRGLSAEGSEIAHVALTNGRFYFEEFASEVEGRQMTVRVNGHEANHESAGFRALSLPAFQSHELADVNAFLLDPRVAPALSAWGVGIDDTRMTDVANVPALAPPTEVPQYNFCYYTPPCGGSGYSSCAEQQLFFGGGSDPCQIGYQQNVCCNNGTAAQRMCGMGSDNYCGAEGPGGCAVCWSVGGVSNCSAYTTGYNNNYQTCWDNNYGTNELWTDYITIGWN